VRFDPTEQETKVRQPPHTHTPPYREKERKKERKKKKERKRQQRSQLCKQAFCSSCVTSSLVRLAR